MKKIIGVRMDCHTGEKQTVELLYEIEDSIATQHQIFRLLNGVTGYESFYITEDVLKDFKDATPDSEGWVACMGTKDRYDKLVVPILEMKKALQLENENK